MIRGVAQPVIQQKYINLDITRRSSLTSGSKFLLGFLTIDADLQLETIVCDKARSPCLGLSDTVTRVTRQKSW